jgi:hypothetical protein
VNGLVALFPVLWFLPEYWGSGHLFRGVNRAHHPRANSPAFAKCPFCTELTKHAWPTVIRRITLAAAVGVLVAGALLWRERNSWWRGWPGRPSWRALITGRRPSPESPERALTPAQRGRAGLLLAAALGAGWWVLIAILTQAGFSGNDRYLVLGAALVAIAGGAGWGWAAHTVAGLVRRLSASRGRPAAPALAAGGGALLAAVVFMATPPWIGGHVVDVQATHRALVYQARLREDMTNAVAKLGGPGKVLACGTVMTEGFQVPMLAWTLGVHTLQIESSTLPVSSLPDPPNVIFQTRAQRHAHLLPIVGDPSKGRYRLVTHVRTFRVYSNCAGKLAA